MIGRRGGRRLLRNLALAAVSSAILGLVAVLAPREAPVAQLSLGTAWAGLLLVGAAMILGPLNLVRDRRNPVSSYFRRDIAIWGGTMALAHTLFGLFVHLQGDWPRYFLWPEPAKHLMPLRYDLFGLANHLGLLASVVFLALLLLSNDWSLRKLGTRRWKSIQQCAYAALGLLLVHAAVYQVLETRLWPPLLVLLACALPIVIMQGLGVSRRLALVQARNAQSSSGRPG